MGKRSNFGRIARDFYETPMEALEPLLQHLPPAARYCEPCAGKGALIDNLDRYGHRCVASFDINPDYNVTTRDAAFLITPDLNGAELIITNPPWERTVLHQLIEQFALLAPTWLLFDADWMHTAQSSPHMEICQKIVSVGRVKWFPDTKTKGKDNCCWYLFDAKNVTKSRPFIGR